MSTSVLITLVSVFIGAKMILSEAEQPGTEHPSDELFCARVLDNVNYLNWLLQGDPPLYFWSEMAVFGVIFLNQR